MRDQLTPGDVYLQIGPLVLHLQISQEDDVFVQIDDPRLPGTPSLPTRILTAAEWREIRNALYVTHPQAPS